MSPAAELKAESPEPFPESDPLAWYDVTLCKFPCDGNPRAAESTDSALASPGIREGFGGGDSIPESPASVPQRRSAQGDNVGSLVILERIYRSYSN